MTRAAGVVRRAVNPENLAWHRETYEPPAAAVGSIHERSSPFVDPNLDLWKHLLRNLETALRASVVSTLTQDTLARLGGRS